jgi:hypothetical protein
MVARWRWIWTRESRRGEWTGNRYDTDTIPIRHRYRYGRQLCDLLCRADMNSLSSDNFRLIFMNTYHGEVYATSDKFSIYASQPANYTTDAGGSACFLLLAFWTRVLALPFNRLLSYDSDSAPMSLVSDKSSFTAIPCSCASSRCIGASITHAPLS